jgi:hypothetical protein
MKKIKITACAIILANMPTSSAFAQFLGGIAGSAKSEVVAGCGPCCFVENKSAKPIRATVALALGAAVSLTVAPGERQVFILGNTCVTSGFGLFVDYL